MARLGQVMVLFVVIAGCGGEVGGDHDPNGEDRTTPPAASSHDQRPAPSSGSPAQPSAPAATPPPQKIGEPPVVSGNGTPLHLVVTNRSKAAGAMKMDLAIDGTPVVTGGFAPDQTFTFDFTVAPGRHEVAARAEYAALVTAQTFEVDAPTERWGVLDATTVRCDPCAPAILSWQVKPAP